ncbi:MAG: ABC transporter permease subunit [Pseudomonadota bacterium]
MSDTHAQTVAYVRDTMLPEQEPPLTEKGIVKWMRENLFSSITNSILTLLAIYVIYTVLSALLPWFFGGVWNAGSLQECRSVLEAFGKTSHDGACWAVIQERWNQFLFGFYPSDQYWRPTLVLVLFLVAIAPILFSEFLPKSMFVFTAIFPFIAVWLIWGGPFWSPLLVMAGFVVGYAVYKVLSNITGGTLAGLGAVAAAIIWWLVLTPMIGDSLSRMVASPQVESAKVELPLRLEAVDEELGDLETQRENLGAGITESLATLTDLEEQIAAARENDSDVSSLLSEYEVARSELAVLRAEDRGLQNEMAILGDERARVNLLNNRVQNIEELVASLPELRQTATDLRANLPDSVASLQISTNLPEDVSDEDADLLEDALAAESALVNAEIAIDGTYSTLGNVGLRPVSSNDIGGFLLAMLMGVSGIVLSLPLGILLALGRQSDMFIINKFCVFFIEVIRGVPLIVWLFTASLLLNYFLPPGTNFDIMLRVIIMVTLFSAAYIAEVIRGGLAALPRGQYEAADALGLDYARSMRLIILPQALKISIPGIVNTFIGLFKDTTLVVFVGLFDPLKQMADSIRSDSAWTGIYWEVFIFPGFIFFLLCYSMGRYSLYLEKKLQREHR